MSKILIPYFNIATSSDISATPIDYGTIQTTFEFRNAIDSKSDNYTLIRSDGDQPIMAELTGLSGLHFLFPDANTAVYLEYGKEAFNTISGVNYLRRRSGPTTVSLTTLDVFSSYGDKGGSPPNDTDVYLSGIEYFGRRRTIFVTEGIDTSTYQQIFFGSVNAITGGYDIRLYNCMFGLEFDLPPGYLIESRSYNVIDTGSQIYNKHYGPIDRSYLAGNQSRDFTLEFDSLGKDDANVVFNIFRYGYGCLPVLFVEDTSDVSTWRRIIMTDLKYTEPVTCSYNMSISCKEIF